MCHLLGNLSPSNHNCHVCSSERLPFLDAIQTTLRCCQPFHSTLLPTRLAKSILPSLTMVLATQSEVQRTDDPVGVSSAGKNKKGKKRARGYEGDEVFRVTREVICPTKQDGDVLMAALHGMLLNWCNVVIKYVDLKSFVSDPTCIAQAASGRRGTVHRLPCPSINVARSPPDSSAIPVPRYNFARSSTRTSTRNLCRARI